MKPVIVLVGRPNVGKSTLFNHLTRTRDALVADFPGLTRDRRYGLARDGARQYVVIDTGGLTDIKGPIEAPKAAQTRLAINETDAIVFLVDAREGLTATDEFIASELRTYNKPIILAVNKTDGIDPNQASAEFHNLGFSDLYPIAASNGRGIAIMMRDVLDRFLVEDRESAEPVAEDTRIRLAFIGRPNVGKSTLINRLLGEERLLTADTPGTTRDSIEVPFERDNQPYTLIDTAGVRRRRRVKEKIEKFSVVKSLQAIESSNVVIMMFDARLGITEQDASLLGLVIESGRAIVLAINKWDGLSNASQVRVKKELDRRLSFMNFAEVHFISARYGSGIAKLMEAVQCAYHSSMIKVSTPALNRLMEQAVRTHLPPLVRGRRIKLRYVHQGGQNPPHFVIHGNQTSLVPSDYKRYLTNYFRTALHLRGTPVRLEFKSGTNPFAGRRNTLTPRQQRKRTRLMRHVKRRH
jgi:GTP-binding protein